METSIPEAAHAHAAPVELVPDLVYTRPGGSPQLLDLYLPRGFARPLPVIVWLHGGGWRLGDRRLGPDLRRFFAARGFAMAGVDYRLSGEAVFPAQLHDVRAAVRWLRAHAEQYGLDGRRIGLWGSSAGGHLAALAALTGDGPLAGETPEHLEQPGDVQAVVDGYGPVDFLQIDAHRQPAGPQGDDPELARMPALKPSADPESFESLLIGAPIEDRPDLVRAASPLTYARPGAPPFLILHGLADAAVPAHQSELLYAALAAHGNDVTLCLVEGEGHSFLNRDDFGQAPRAVTVRRSAGGRPEVVTDGPPLTFATIEAFFRRHLCDVPA